MKEQIIMIKKYINVLRNNEDLSYGGSRTLKMIENLIDEIEKHNQCDVILEKVKEAWTPDKRSFEEAEKDKAYLNECIEKATPNLSKIKDVDKELAEIKGQGWICPRCGKVHSWLSMECDCKPAGTWSTTYDPSDFPSIH
jgi:DNA repair exonuclease SbcCD ATPase subunit